MKSGLKDSLGGLQLEHLLEKALFFSIKAGHYRVSRECEKRQESNTLEGTIQITGQILLNAIGTTRVFHVSNTWLTSLDTGETRVRHNNTGSKNTVSSSSTAAEDTCSRRLNYTHIKSMRLNLERE